MLSYQLSAFSENKEKQEVPQIRQMALGRKLPLCLVLLTADR
jgi:hypothetical protein